MANALPVAADLQSFLTSANSFDAAWNLDLQSALDAAVEELEEKTKHRPFLASTTPETRSFTMNSSRILQLDCGLARLDAVSTGFYGAFGYVTTAFNANYFAAKPLNAAQTNKPITRIEFFAPVSGIVQIAGLWGYGLTVPSMAFEAILSNAAKRLAPRIAAAKSGLSGVEAGLVKARQMGPIREEFTTGAEGNKGVSFSSQIAQWQSDFDETVALYRIKRI